MALLGYVAQNIIAFHLLNITDTAKAKTKKKKTLTVQNSSTGQVISMQGTEMPQQ